MANPAMKLPIMFTIGHTTHSFEVFLGLLLKHGVSAIADVRSHPYSGRFPQFNREELIVGLKAFDIRYAFLGKELGARRVEQDCFDADRVVYQRIAQLPKFREGLARLRRGAVKYRIALLCAEKEPLDCHRTILVCRELRQEFTIQHIMADGTTEDHSITEKRLVREMDISPTLFEPDTSDEALILRAYDKRAKEIAYRITAEEPPP